MEEMNKKKADLTDVRVAEQSRNITAITGICIMNGILAAAYLLEFFKGTRTIASCAVILVWTILPSVAAVAAYLKKRDTITVRYITSIGFAILYTYIRFTTTTNLAFCYIIVIYVILAVYVDRKLSVVVGSFAVAINIAVVIYKAAAIGLSPIEITETEIIIACLILSSIFTLMAHSKISRINQANIEKAKKEKQQSEMLLTMVLQVADDMAENLENASKKTEALKKSIGVTKGAMEELTGGANDAVTAILKQQKNTEEINMKIAEVEEITASIIENVDSAENSLVNGKQIMNQLIRQVEVSDEASQTVAREMDELREYAGKMQGIMALISNVATQTGLLALNASIEAARAGEAGKGFAVVASEISNLAGQTGSATGDINALIENITNSLGEVAESVGSLLESNAMQNGYVNSTAENFEMIHTNTNSIFEQMKKLKASVDEVGEANKVIIESVENVSAVTEEVTAGANETLEGSRLNLERIADIAEVMEAMNRNAEKLKKAEKS